MSEKKILLVGFACLDICLLCKYYPTVEDTGHRVREVIKRRGGNCSNSCTALSHFKVPCHLLTTFGNDAEAEWTKKELSDLGVTLTNCPKADQPTPITYLILSDETGSRTTFLWKENWPLPSCEDFKKLDLNEYSWVHFEGRNLNELKKMIAHVREWNKSRKESERLRISVEIEQDKDSLSELIPLGDVIILSKDFAHHNGLRSMEETVHKYKNIVRPDASIVVPWGEKGAMGYLPDGTTFHQPAFPPKKVVDSVAAGDTFIAALIAVLSKKQTLQEATEFACRAAGAKVGVVGFNGLMEAISSTH